MRVLYVDDDDGLARLVQKTLGRRGAEVMHVATIGAALQAIAIGKVDVIALDHYLSNATGLDFLKQLSDLSTQTPPVVYVTGSTEMNVAVAALKAGAADFVLKSVGDDFMILLATALEQAVEKSRLRFEKEQAEREVRVARDRAEMLLAEVNHRVANSLSLVSSLVGLQAKSLKDQGAKDALAETQARIFAIGQVHQRLYTSGDVRHVALDEYLGGLLDHMQTAMRDKGHSACILFELAPMHLKTDASINLGVVVTEWVTNAFKYAYRDRSGEIRVRLHRLESGLAELLVEDDGVGFDATGAVKGTGLGSRIVKAMARSLNAEIEYLDRKPGVSARLMFPVEAN